MSIQTLSSPADVELVAQSLAGDRGAFGRIVQRYQSLICALAFSATGNVSRSEDLAQETFVTAWRRLRDLREPAKLRPWLCGIARHNISADFRRQGREPVHAAAPLEEAEAIASAEPAPAAQAVTNEEAALLWREVGQLPEIYREPLILFYREHRSAALVGQALELTEDAVMQRLSRGRRLLHERMLAFVETTLERTNPGPDFTANVQAVLPVLAAGSQAAAVATAKGAAAKSGLAALFAWAAPFVGLFAALGLCITSIRHAPNARSRRFAVLWSGTLWLAVVGLVLALYGLNTLGWRLHWSDQTKVVAGAGVWFFYTLVLGSLLVLRFRRDRSAHPDAGGAGASTRTLTGVVIACYLASGAWVIGWAWTAGDRWTAAAVTVLAAAGAAWDVRRVRDLPRAEAGRLIGSHNLWFSGVLLAVLNLRLDRWLAPSFRLSLDQMHQLLPMGLVHLLSAILVAWIVALLLLTAPDEAR